MRQRRSINSLFVMIMTLALAACGAPEDTSRQEAPTAARQESTDAEESVGTEESTDAEESAGTEESETAVSEADVSIEPLGTTADLEETVLVDEKDIKISVTGIEYKKNRVELKLALENNSDSALEFISSSMGYGCNAVNGYMLDGGYLNVNIAAGKKANETIHFSNEELSLYGITELADIQLGFDVRDEDYEHIYTGVSQVRTSAADSYDYEADTYRQSVQSRAWEKLYKCAIDYFAEEELYSQGGIQIVSEALMTSKDGEKAFLIEVVNNSEEQIAVTCSDITLNGLVIYASNWSGDYINPKSRRVIDLEPSAMMDEAYWEAVGISEIGAFTFSFAAYDAENEEVGEPQEISIAISEAAAIDDSGDELYNENGIRIISKGLIADPLSFSDDVHMLLLAENLTSGTVYIDDVYDSLSVNDFMVDYYMLGWQVPPGKYAFIDVEIKSSSLEENDIAGMADIAEAEISLELRDESYDTIAEPTLLISY